MENTNDRLNSLGNMPHLVKDEVTKDVTFDVFSKTRTNRTANKNIGGFSLIELLLVVVTIGILVALAVPKLQQTVRMAENGQTFATMRSISSTQIGYFSSHSRFARLTELNNIMSGALGTPSGNDVNRGKFVLSMTPAAPTDLELKDGYTITATRNQANESIVYVYELTQTGEIRQILP